MPPTVRARAGDCSSPLLYPIPAATPRVSSGEPGDGMGEEERRRLGANIQCFRKARGLTQQELADRAGVEQKQVSRIERGEISPTVDTVAKIARALGVPIGDLFAPQA